MFFSTKESWIPREHQRGVVTRLLDLDLIKFDNNRSLPLKMGGTTDVYINLRNARDRPEAIAYLRDVYMEPLKRLDVKRFVEVPDSVSCFAGPLSIASGIPYLTIREEAKEGRVTKARTIGNPQVGEAVCIIDDVVTDGQSKIEPYRECQRLGLSVRALVVLIDRQQGWQENLGRKILAPNVWAGMTLHDVRRELVKMGEMKRCDENVEGKNPIIVALDDKSWDEVLPIVDRLRTTGCIWKVNDLVFDLGMSHLLPELSVYGRVMVDLKNHDIPNTVSNVCKRVVKHNPWAVTVHASGGGEMVRAAVKALSGCNTKVLAITALTSLNDGLCGEVYGCSAVEAVGKLARIAFEAGAHGLVLSPREVMVVRAVFPDTNKILVTPGVRSEGSEVGDQSRVSTPKGAMVAGANHIVMGRQVLGAKDPVAEVRRILTEELEISL